MSTKMIDPSRGLVAATVGEIRVSDEEIEAALTPYTPPATAAPRRANAKLSMEHPDWYTPSAIVEAARAVLGTIDLDPASDAEANQVVQAIHYLTEDDDGLYTSDGETRVLRAWNGRVFLNPPGGQVRAFWSALLMNVAVGNTTEAIWVGYSLEQLQSLQVTYEQLEIPTSPLHYAMCVPKKRITFVENESRRLSRLALEAAALAREIWHAEQALADYDAAPDTQIERETLTRRINTLCRRKPRATVGSPTHGNYITYLGPNVARFVEVFSSLGVTR